MAEHDLVSEVYHIIDGSATLVLGSDITDLKRRPADDRAVRLLNGPGGNGASIRNGATYQLKPGDVVIIPAGVGHWFTKIDDHISYLMVRVDPDKVTPLKDEAASKADLSSTPSTIIASVAARSAPAEPALPGSGCVHHRVRQRVRAADAASNYNRLRRWSARPVLGWCRW